MTEVVGTMVQADSGCSVRRTAAITLTCNRPEWLAEAKASIDTQSNGDWEHLIYDRDWSMSKEGISCLRQQGKRTTIRQRYNEPVVFTVGHYWNMLLAHVSSDTKYITILDDDNRKRPDFIEKMIAPMEADESVDAVSCGWAVIDEAGALTGCEHHDNLDTSLLRMWRDNTIDSNAVVFRRSVLDKIGLFDASLTTNEDWHFMIRLVRACKMVHLPECLLEYRVHPRARSRDAVVLGAHQNWYKIRKELFTKDEWREALTLTAREK